MIGVRELALALPSASYRILTWREGTNAPLSSRFARVSQPPDDEAGREGPALTGQVCARARPDAAAVAVPAESGWLLATSKHIRARPRGTHCHAFPTDGDAASHYIDSEAA